MTTSKEKKLEPRLSTIFRGRKVNAVPEKAIQEAMMELDRMTDD